MSSTSASARVSVRGGLEVLLKVLAEEVRDRTEALALLLEARAAFVEQLLAVHPVECRGRVLREQTHEFQVGLVEGVRLQRARHHDAVRAQWRDDLRAQRRILVEPVLVRVDVLEQSRFALAVHLPHEAVALRELREPTEFLVRARGRRDRVEHAAFVVDEPHARDREAEQLPGGVRRDRTDLRRVLRLEQPARHVVQSLDHALVLALIGDVPHDARDALAAVVQGHHADLADAFLAGPGLELELEPLEARVAPSDRLDRLPEFRRRPRVDRGELVEAVDVLADERLAVGRQRRLDRFVHGRDGVVRVDDHDAVVDGFDDARVLVQPSLARPAVGDVLHEHGQPVLPGVRSRLEPRVQWLVVDVERDRVPGLHRLVEALRELRLDGLRELVPHDAPEEVLAGPPQEGFGAIVQVREPPVGVEREERVLDAVEDGLAGVGDGGVVHRGRPPRGRDGSVGVGWRPLRAGG